MPILDLIVKQEINKQEKLLAEFARNKVPVVIYGAGVYAYVLYRYLLAKDVNVVKFAVDKEYRFADQYMGVPLISLEEMQDSKDDNHIIIGVANYPVVVSSLRSKGFSSVHIVDVPDFLNIPSAFLDMDFIRNYQESMNAAYNVFADELSRQTFVGALNCKLNNDLEFIRPFVKEDHLYFATAEFPLSKKEVLLDVGGFNGDSIKDFCKVTHNEFEYIYSLEPFTGNFKKLKKTIEELGLENQCEPKRIGAWNTKDTLTFDATEMEIDSKIGVGGNQYIDVDTIDTIASDFKHPISFIKMDINGAEYNALFGAREVIKKYHPRIAVKMHVKEDFYRLPLLLKEIDPHISLYLRQRNYMSMMLVLYGVFHQK